MEKPLIYSELYNIWEYVKKVCLYKNGQRYEGVPLEEGWDSFDNFIKDNWIRYYRAKIKWRNYKRVSPRKDMNLTGKLKTNNVRFVRKIKEEGYTLKNTVFTSPSDCTKYSNSTHKFILEDRVLGTRDVKNILKKKGVNVNMETITQRKRNKHKILSYGPRKRHFWKGKYRNFMDISKMENVNYDVLKKHFYKIKDIKKAVESARKSIPRKKKN